ncbi:MAG: AI-2E family transporter [Minwuia sp.]|nr:AI-2E family transporter [Minwuia sp.]
MSPQRQASFWFICIIALGLVVFLLRDMLLPFVVAMAVAYLTDPLADWLEKMRLSRNQATIIITAGFVIIFLLGLLILVPLVVRQSGALLVQLPEYIERATRLLQPIVANLLEAASDRGVDVSRDEGAQALKNYASQAVQFFTQLAGNVVRGGAALANFLALLVITPIVTFYLLLEWDRLVALINGWLPKRYAGTIRKLVVDIDRTLAGFVRGQGTVCLVLMVYYATALSMSGLSFGFLIGILSGALSFIPFVGAIFGAIASIGLAIVQFWPDDMVRVAIVVGIYAVGQVAEGYFLTPNLVGDRIGLHPVWVMFGVLAGGVLFGFVGMLLALPVSAVIGVVARFGLEQYLQSRFYDPANPE